MEKVGEGHEVGEKGRELGWKLERRGLGRVWSWCDCISLRCTLLINTRVGPGLHCDVSSDISMKLK